MKFKRIALLTDNTERAKEREAELRSRYEFVGIQREENPDVAVVLGGDGFMLQILHKLINRNIPVYGMNCGSIGFLLNGYSEKNLPTRLNNAYLESLRPLLMYAETTKGKKRRLMAINEVSLFRASRQTAKLRVSINHLERIDEMICDGVLVSTPAGSTAYNFSAGGPIVPLSANIMALTPLSPFRPRRWKGALLDCRSSIHFDILNPEKRPVSVVADSTEIKHVKSVSVTEEVKSKLKLLFDPEQNLQERVVREQFIF